MWELDAIRKAYGRERQRAAMLSVAMARHEMDTMGPKWTQRGNVTTEGPE
jgi:hypothetical protein